MNQAEQIARDNFNRWNDALQTGVPATVAGMYTGDASFLPTVSPEFKHGAAGAESYFEHFLAKDPVGIIVEDEVQKINDSTILHSGLYNFEVGPEDDRSVVEGRFTFLWIKEGDKWKIAHHHSSIKPTA